MVIQENGTVLSEQQRTRQLMNCPSCDREADQRTEERRAEKRQ